MDNFKLEVVAESRATFDLAMQIAFTGNSTEGMAKEWVIDGEKGFVFLWHKDTHGETGKPSTPFPLPLKWKAAADIAWAWLQSQEYPEQPGHDGSNGKGFRIYNDAWSEVENWDYSIIAVKPEWCWYGK